MSKNIINQRFIKCINFLLESKKVPSKSFLAEIFNISSSKFSEILKERMNVGVDILMILVSEFNISSEWLLTGQGSMLKENKIITTGRDNHGVNNTGDMDNSNITINQGYTREQNRENIAENQEFNNEIISLLKAQLKDKEEKEALLKDKIAELEEKLKFAEFRDKKDMDFKIKAQRKEKKEKDEIILAQTHTINELNEENNALKSRHLPPDEPLQPSKGL